MIQAKQHYRSALQEYRRTLLDAIYIKYGSIEACPPSDILFQKLQLAYGAEPTVQYHKYDKQKVEALRIARNIRPTLLSEQLGFSKSWYNHFRASTQFTERNANMLADYFGVGKDFFIAD